jgi:hypothetical protein
MAAVSCEVGKKALAFWKEGLGILEILTRKTDCETALIFLIPMDPFLQLALHGPLACA